MTSYNDVEGNTLSVANGTILTLRCVTNKYVLYGERSLTCVEGVWSDVMPACVCKCPENRHSGISCHGIPGNKLRDLGSYGDISENVLCSK